MKITWLTCLTQIRRYLYSQGCTINFQTPNGNVTRSLWLNRISRCQRRLMRFCSDLKSRSMVMSVNGASYCEYVSGGQVRKMVTSITGLSHLEGEAVQVQ